MAQQINIVTNCLLAHYLCLSVIVSLQENLLYVCWVHDFILMLNRIWNTGKNSLNNKVIENNYFTHIEDIILF